MLVCFSLTSNIVNSYSYTNMFFFIYRCCQRNQNIAKECSQFLVEKGCNIHVNCECDNYDHQCNKKHPRTSNQRKYTSRVTKK